MKIDPIEVIARLLGRDRELRLVDQALEVHRGKLERVRHLACGEIGKVALRQGLQREARAAGTNRQQRPIAGALDYDLSSFRQLAHYVVKHMRRHRRRAGRPDFGRNRLAHFDIEIGRLEGELGIFCLDEHVCENRNGVAALDHSMHMSKRFQQCCALDGNLHSAHPREEKRGTKGGACDGFAQERARDDPQNL